METKSLLIVDDHPIVREGISQLISQQHDMRICGSATDSASALHAVRELKPDVALVDISLGRESGIDLIPRLLEVSRSLPILALSMHDEALYAKRVLQLGARGYIMKQEGTDVLLGAIRRVIAGEIYVSAGVNATLLFTFASGRGRQSAATIAGTSAALGGLSNRELQVYQMIGRGLATKEIASQLFLSAKTVETHRARIKQKLALSTNAALIAHAAEWLVRSGAPGKSLQASQ